MKRFYRSVKDKQIAGICGGLGEYLNVDSNLIRIVMILFFVLTGFLGVIAYLIAWMIVPLEGESSLRERKLFRSREDKKIAGVCGGIAKYLGHDSTFIRLIFIILFVLSGFIPMLVFYVLVWFFIPYEEIESLS